MTRILALFSSHYSMYIKAILILIAGFHGFYDQAGGTYRPKVNTPELLLPYLTL